VVSENLSSTDEGQVLVLEGSSTGLFASAGSSQTFAQGVDGMLGSAESSDFFGEVLASGDYDDDGFDDLAVGVPSENVFLGSGANEGVVAVISGSATGLTTIGNVSLDQGDVSGQSLETEDRFGAALASGDFDGDGRDELAIGVPGENQGEGRVHVFRRFTGAWGVQGSPWGQAVPGMPGIAEQGDLFGDALAAGDFDGDGFVDLAVGAPGDRSSGMTSGALHVLYGTTGAGLSLADTQYWSQGDLAIAGTGPSSGSASRRPWPRATSTAMGPTTWRRESPTTSTRARRSAA
jgi:hypothetical protein